MNDQERLERIKYLNEIGYIIWLKYKDDTGYDKNAFEMEGEINWLISTVEKQQQQIGLLNETVKFQIDVLDETKTELKGAKEDYSRLLQTAEEITEQHRKEIERLKDYSQKSANVALLAELENENARLRQEIEAMTGHYHNAARQKNKSDGERIKLKQEIERLRQFIKDQERVMNIQDECMVKNGREIMKRDDERADLQYRVEQQQQALQQCKETLEKIAFDADVQFFEKYPEVAKQQLEQLNELQLK